MIAIIKNRWFILVAVLSLGACVLVSLLSKNLDFDFIILSLAIIFSTFLLISASQYNDSHPNLNKYTGQERQSIELLKNLNTMVNHLEYRDNILRQEKEIAEEANKAKSNFVSHMSHELRTPIHAILNFADLGKDCCNTHHYDESLIIYFTRISESGERLLILINGLLDLTMLESGKAHFRFETNDMNQCIKYVCNELSATLNKKSIVVDIKNDTSISPFIFDKNHITMVLINILSNAIKFSPERGLITIRIEHAECNISNNSRPGIKVMIEDQGIGIPENEQEIIFNKFIQASNKPDKAAGNGLGLAICKEIINAHEGHIWAENNESQGLSVGFIIPR